MYELINDVPLEIKEYNGQRVVTFKDIDTVHGRPEGTAKRNFNTNREYFIEGVDFFKVCADEIRTHKIIDLSPKAHEDITLVTLSGYLMIVKSFTDDLSWSIQRLLINSYFRVQEQNQNYNDLLQHIQSLESRIATLESKQTKTKKPLLTDADEKLKSEIEKFLDIPITEDWYYLSFDERKKYIKDYQNGTAIAGTYKRDHISVKEIACELLGYDLNQPVSRRMSLKIARILIDSGLTKKTAKKWLCVYQAQWTYEK